MALKTKALSITALLLSFAITRQALAENSPISSFPASPGVSFTGLYGDVSSLYADSLIPVMGYSSRSFFYVDPQGIFHNKDEYSTSLGAGYRLLQDRWGILGAGLFADYNHSSSQSFWFISPGLERLGDRFDFSLNGYFSISRQRFNTGQEFADNTGDNSSVSFKGHDQIDQLVDTFKSTGPGADFTVGVRLPFLTNNTKLYLGTYYFAPKDNDSIFGGAARLEVPLNRFFSVIASEAYDGVMHNTAKIGLNIALGGRNSGYYYKGNLEERLVDPVQRQLAALSGGSATAEPTLAGTQYTGDYAIERSNIWFFATNGSADTCTADSPCQLSQEKINSINSTTPGTNLYVETGQYNFSSSADKLTLNKGQSLFGRTQDFTAAADWNSMPVFFGSLGITGNNDVERLKLQNFNSQSVGISIDDYAKNVTLNTISVGDSGWNSSLSYKTAIQLGSHDTVQIENSRVYASSSRENNGGLVSGIKLDGASDSHLKIDNSTIQVWNNTLSDSAGIFVGNDQATKTNAENNQISLNKDNIQLFGLLNSKSAFGVYLGNYFSDNDSSVDHNDLNIKDSQIIVKNDHGLSFGVFTGNYEYSAPGFDDNTINIDGSSISASSPSNAYGIFEGMFNGVNSLAVANTMTINNSQITAVSQKADAYAVELDGYNSVFNLTNNIIQATDDETDAVVRRYVYGLNLQGSNDTLNLNGNRITSQGEGSNILVVGLGQGIYYTDIPNNNVINASDNWIKASSQSDNANVNAVLIQNNGAVINLENDTLLATGSGNSAAVFAVQVAGDNNNVSITHSQISAIASGLNGNAEGVVANSGYGDYASSSNNTIKLDANSISAISLLGKAEAISDNLADKNHNTWTILSNNQIFVHGWKDYCQFYFNGNCYSAR